MDDRQQRRLSSRVDENDGLHNRGEPQGSLQMAAIRRQYADREQLEVDLARRRSADIIASARQSARESIERVRQQLHEIRHRWDGSYQRSDTSHQQSLRNALSGNSSEPRVGHYRMSEIHPSLAQTDPAGLVCGPSWDSRTAQFASNNAPIRDRGNINESRLMNSSTYFHIQIDHSCSSSNFRSTADLTLPPAYTSRANGGRVGTRTGHSQHRRHDSNAMQETVDRNPDVMAGHFPGLRAGCSTRPPIQGFAGHNALRETASFVNSPACSSERNHFNPRWRSSNMGLSENSGFYEPPAYDTDNEYGLAKEDCQIELPASGADACYGLPENSYGLPENSYGLPENSYGLPENNHLPDISRLPTCGDHRMSENIDQPVFPVMLVGVLNGLPEVNYQHELPASHSGQSVSASGLENVREWSVQMGDENEEGRIGENMDAGQETDGILASLNDMEQIIQKMEEDVQKNGRGTGRNDSPVKPEDISALWQVIAECEGVAQTLEDSGNFDAGETMYEWSLDRLDKLATVCYRFVVCLISDIAKISDRSKWKPEEFRVYMDAALLVKKTCQKMMEATADEQVSLRHPPSGTLLQILLIYIRTMRLMLELYSLLNSFKPTELSTWSSSLHVALKAFITEVTRDLLDFHELLSGRLPINNDQRFQADGNDLDDEMGKNPQEDNDQKWKWGENDTNAGDYETTLREEQLRHFRSSEDGDRGGGGGAGSGEAGLDVMQNPTSLNHYHHETSFSDNIEDPYYQGLVIPSGPEYRYASLYNESNHETEGESDGGSPRGRTDPVFTNTAAAAANESEQTTDVETDQAMEGSYPADYFGQDTTNSELTSEELEIFQSMLSPSTFQLFREGTPEENIMLALSVQMASQVLTDASPGLFNGAVYDDEQSQAETFDILVNRSSETLLDDLVQLYINAPMKLLHSRLNIVFEGEPGIDGGALSREFFCLIFQALIDRTIMNRCVFEGDRGHLLPAVDYVLNEAKVFWIVGILVAQAACNGCHGLPGLSPAVRRFLAGGARVSSLEEISHLTTLEDVADLDLRNLLKKMRDRKELNEEEKSSLETWLNQSGFSFVMSEAKTDEAINRILRYYVFESRMSQLVSIAEGMEELGWRPVPLGFDVETVFPSGEEISLEDFFLCLCINQTLVWRSLDPRVQKSFMFFQKFCAELHQGKLDKLRLSDLLHFFTGAPYLKSGANVTYSSPDTGVIYPQARTCNLELIIPTLHKTYEDFKAAFSQALLLGSYGFGFA